MLVNLSVDRWLLPSRSFNSGRYLNILYSLWKSSAKILKLSVYSVGSVVFAVLFAVFCYFLNDF